LTANLSTLLDRFRALPANIQEAVNAPEALAAMRRLDGRYPKLNATDVVLRGGQRQLRPVHIADSDPSAQGLNPSEASRVRSELDQTVLARALALLRQGPARILPSAEPPPAVREAPTPLASAPAPVRPVAPAVPPKPAALAPQKPASAFFYHAEDESDIAKHRQRLDQMQPVPVVDPNAVADRIATEQGLRFDDPNLAARYRTVAVAALKGIRKNYDTKDLLTRSTKIGGLGFSAEAADQLLAKFAARAGELGSPVSPSGAREPTVPASPRRTERPEIPTAPTVPLRTLTPRPVATGAPPPPPPNLPVSSTPQPADALGRSGLTIPAVSAPSSPSATATVPPPVPPPVRPAPAPRVSEPRGRPVVADVRRPKRTVGPVDELGLLTVDDLRRLDRDPEVALTKVWNKLENLGKESFALFAEGVKGWRRSPLYHLYVFMGTESMSSGRAVDEVANARNAANQPTLTPHEFGLVADFNRHLRL
jgi:hypothetical protein